MVLRQDRTGIDKKFFELCTKVVTDEGLYLYDMDYLPGSFCLRLFILQDGTDTALIEDCAKVDKALSPYIEESDWMPEILNLEVSSPGLFRQLTCVEHFKSVCGKHVNLNLKSNLSEYVAPGVEIQKKQNKAKNLIFELTEVKDKGLEVEIYNNKLFLAYEEIKKANLETIL
jgi:ribosome maturation factor RimP